MSKSMENKTAAIYLCRSTEDEPSAVTHCCSECADALITVKFRRDLAYLPGPRCAKSSVAPQPYAEGTISSGGLAMPVTKNNAANVGAARALSRPRTALSSGYITW